MTEEEYIRERDGWISSIYSIPKRRHFPRCVRYRLVQLAKLEATHHGTSFREEYDNLWERLMQ